MRNKTKTILLFIFLTLGFQGFSQKKKLKKKPLIEVSSEKKADTLSDSKKYDELLKKAVVKNGLFKVIQKKTDFYFEIPDSLFKRSFLVVNKISQVPMQLNEAGINKGMNFENKYILFEKDTLAKKVWVKTLSPIVFSPDKQAITKSVASNFAPSILEVFDIHSLTSSSTVIKINKVFDGKEKSFNDVLTHTGMGGSIKTNLSFIETIKSFPENIVVRSSISTSVNEGGGNVPITIGVTSNIVLLPKEPMKARFEDERVGYFTENQWHFNDNQHALEKQKIVTRWRLEPKEEDKKAYLNGELVPPKKPITFYIDPATPPQWRKYIVQGVLDWNSAFERAGFKNAIQAIIPNENITDFDLDDSRFSGITYVASPKANAMGPSVTDPRSGEILEADIVWWHNVMTLLHNWIRIQTGTTNTQAQKNIFSEELIGESIRFVSSHEVGHTFGLKHNMGASSAYPVDSLRVGSFVEKNNISTSIMDYARYNYVAQPQDNIPVINPVIGEYDKYAIEWGYRWFETSEQEQYFLQQFVNERAHNPLYFYGPQQHSNNSIDPRSLAESLGDNTTKASIYGLQNLKLIMQNLLNWTSEKGKNYTQTGKLYQQIINQWQLYNEHTLANIGGMFLNNLVSNDGKNTYIPVPYQQQIQAIDYLNENVFSIPQWLFFNNDVLQKTYPIKETPNGNLETSPYVLAREYQYSILYQLFDDDRLLRLLEGELSNTKNEKRLTTSDLFSQVRKYIFKKKKKLSILERMTQKNYVDCLIVSSQKLFEKTNPKKIEIQNHFCCFHSEDKHINPINFGSLKRVSEITSIKRNELEQVLKIIKNLKGNAETQAHYNDLKQRIEQELFKN